MVPLLVVAALLGVTGGLLWARDAQARSPGSPRRVDHFGGRSLVVSALILAAISPIEPARGLLGFGTPAECKQKPHSTPRAVQESSDIEALKAEMRHRSLERELAAPRVRATSTRELSRLTGPGSSNQTKQRWNVYGTDLGHPFLYRGRLGLVFGDTFGNAERDDWRSNVMAWAERPTPDELVFTGMPDRTGSAQELIGSLKLRGLEQTAIPTYAVAPDDRIVIHYMSIVCWGLAGSWVADHASLAVSHDGGRTFTRNTGPRWAGDGGFVQVAFVEAEDHIYAFGLPSGRDGHARLARVRPERIADPDGWSYWDGHAWVAAPDAAVPVVTGPVGELSVQWNVVHETWVMMYLHEGRGGIVLRTADELTGPWSAAELVASGVDFPQLYAPYLLPGDSQGSAVHFTLSRYDIYNVLLMRTRLLPAEEDAPTDSF